MPVVASFRSSYPLYTQMLRLLVELLSADKHSHCHTVVSFYPTRSSASAGQRLLSDQKPLVLLRRPPTALLTQRSAMTTRKLCRTLILCAIAAWENFAHLACRRSCTDVPAEPTRFAGASTLCMYIRPDAFRLSYFLSATRPSLLGLLPVGEKINFE